MGQRASVSFKILEGVHRLAVGQDFLLTCLLERYVRTSRRLVQVRPAEISSMESRNLVRIRSFSMTDLPGGRPHHGTNL